MPFKFGVDSSGNYGYIKDGADTVTPFLTRTGNATAGQVLSGRTFSNASSSGLTGTMKNNGAVSKTITPSSSSSQTYTIPAGYHNGSGKVTVSKVGAPSNAYVYYRGDLCYSVTGGWRHPMHSSYYSVGFTTDHIYLYDGCSTFPVHTITEKKIDVSNYSYINLAVKIITDDDSDRAFKVQLCSATSYDSDGITASKTYTYSTNHTSESSVTIKHNISSVSGSYYLRLYAVLCNVRVYEIYFS